MTVPDEMPVLRQTVLDGVEVRALAEFYRQLLGYRYRPGDEPPTDGDDGDEGDDGADRADRADWLVLRPPGGGHQLAFQQVDELPRVTWPEGPVPQQLHLDLTVPAPDELNRQHDRVLALGGRLLLDRFDDPQEPLRVYADPAGHPFCIFVG